MLELNRLYLMDCMQGMAQFPDKYFQLAVCDPPYGINFGEWNRTNKCSNGERIKANKYKNGDWDAAAPSQEYFRELMRVSQNQIIWGGNYFELPPCRGFVFWYKRNPVANFSDGEFAWTSFDCVARCFDHAYFGNVNAEPDRIHPTQKPITLYRWLLQHYAKPGDKILDTHVGSASSLIACHQMGFDFIGFEIDPDYHKAATERLERARAQVSVFDIGGTEQQTKQIRMEV